MRYVLRACGGLCLAVAAACGGDSGGGTRTATPAISTATAMAGTATPVITPAAATGTATPSPGVTSGIRGLVTIGPTCPVERPESPCPDRPFEATIEVLGPGGTVVAEVRSDAEGRFEIALAAGIYALHPVTGSTPPSAADQVATVLEGAVTEVTIAFDSGIR